MTAQYTDSERSRLRRKTALWFVGCLVAAPGLWALGAPRYALVSFLGAVMLAVMGWGPKAHRLPPNRDEPTTMASSFSFLVGIAGFAAIALVMLPYPRLALGAAIWAVALTVAWVWTLRWPRSDPPLVS